MTIEDRKARILEFVQRNKAARESRPPDAQGAYYAVYGLHREDAVLVSLPLFELMLIRLGEGGPEAHAVADACLKLLGLTRSDQPPV